MPKFRKLDQAITVGAVIWFVLAAACAVMLLGALAFILSLIASGFNH